MKRDFELIRTLLLQIEQSPAGEIIQIIAHDEGISGAVVAEHLKLLIDAGLVEGEVYSVSSPAFAIQGLTWQGHDFIEKARNDVIWKKVITEAKTKGYAITISLLSDLLTNAVKTGMGF
jgi:DNA-binding HxlR family transcriptional regulator